MEFHFKHVLLFLFTCNIYYCLEYLYILTLSADNIQIIVPKISRYNKVEYAVIVFSSAENYEKRKIIRHTWFKLIENINGNKNKHYKWNIGVKEKIRNRDYVKFCFVIGTKNLKPEDKVALMREDALHNDMLMLSDLDEQYSIKSRKTLLSVKWCYLNLPRLKYLIKGDDDTFMRIDILIHHLENNTPFMLSKDLKMYISKHGTKHGKKGLLWGFINGNGQIYSDGPWKETEWFLCDRYLPYALGGGYVISRSVVHFIGTNDRWLSMYNSEDVSMGLWTAPLKIMRIHDIRFDSEWSSRGCKDYMLVRHNQTTREMQISYINLIKSRGKNHCSKIFEQRPLYFYEWRGSPNKCCVRKWPAKKKVNQSDEEIVERNATISV